MNVPAKRDFIRALVVAALQDAPKQVMSRREMGKLLGLRPTSPQLRALRDELVEAGIIRTCFLTGSWRLLP